MKTLKNHIPELLTAALSLGTLLLPAVAASAPGNLANQPLFTQNAVDPNVMLGIDDSSSMDFEVLFTTNDGALYWDAANKSFHSLSDGTITSSEKYVYLFPNGEDFNSGSRVNKDNNHHHAIPPFIQYAYTRSPNYNKAYYNPDITYTPWTSYGNQTFTNIDPTNAPSDPHTARSAEKFDLTGNIYYTGSGELFTTQKNMVIPKGTKYNGSATATASDTPADNNEKQISIEYKAATYYTVVNSGTYQVEDLGNTPISPDGNCASPNPVHYTYLEATPGSFVGSSGVDSLGPDGRCLRKHTITTADTDQMQNFANWFSYYRKRHLALRNGLTAAFDDITGVRVGMFTINDRGGDVTMRDFDTEKDTVFSQIYSEEVSGGTPNRQAMDYAGQQYQRKGTGAPITDECQKNFTIFFTDGFSSLPNPLSNLNLTNSGNHDGDNFSPYADGYDDTLADIAMYYYENNLRGDLPKGQVPVSSQCDVTPVDKQLDCNKDLHMVTYTVGLGALGTIFNNTVGTKFYDEVVDVYTNPVTWPNVNTARDPRQIDDLYHAAVNGRGEMFSADTPADLATELKEALQSITEQTGSAASVAFNTSVLSTGSVVYQARFNTDKWKGELLSFALNPLNGNVAATASWDAADNLPAANDRTIYTYNPDAGNNKGVLFKAGANDDLSGTTLPSAALGDLRLGLPTTSGLNPELTARDRLNYLRGDRTYEGPEASSGKSRFRARHADTVLGDIVHSAPLFVGAPALNWPTGDGVTSGSFPSGTSSYETWKAGVSRTPMVYVGANDGMLHGFDANNGTELMAYVPSSLYSSAASEGLHYLSDPGYQHRYYVDNTPSRTDAYIKGRSATGAATSRAWRSIIVGTLRGGGKGVFALDVTNPGSFADTAGSAAQTALWEFTSNDDADLGFTYSRPTIVPTNATDGSDIRWAAIFGNGYNNGGDCRAKLFVVFLDGGLDGTWTEGTDYLKMDTNTGTTADCNGLSTPAVVDLNADGKADAVYAGDLHGNMWNFDLCNKDNAGLCRGTGWGVAYDTGGGGATAAPLFTARDAGGSRQPITAQPIVISHPTILSGGLAPNVLVLFGTGQYLVDGDKADTAPPSHSYYGVWDRGDAGLDRSRLMQQIFETGFGAGADFRITGLDEPDYTNSNANNREYGWYLDLPDTSEADNSAAGAPERVVTRSVVIGDIVFFNTLVPTANGCDIGGYGYLMSVETKNGGRPDSSIIDVNGDGTINDSDFQTVGTEDAAVVGKKTNEGILSEPSFLGDKRYESTSKGKILKDDVDPPGLTSTGRYSWSEIRDE